MKRFFTKIFRFFWSWGLLKFVIVVISLIVLLYVEEDWRGARAWAATKAKWEAKGETFDLDRFIPPSIPDGQNLAAIPLFKLEPIEGTQDSYPVALRRAMRSQQGSGYELPSLGGWNSGKTADMEKIHRAIADDYSIVFKKAPPVDDTLAQFDALYPFIAELRAAVTTHPFCRLNLDYTTFPPAGRALSTLTDQIKLSQILTLHAILELEHHRPDIALEDIKITNILRSGAGANPTLVGGLVALGMNAIGKGAIYYGLAAHAWNDAQLVEIDSTLRKINFLAVYQFDFRAEAAVTIANVDFYKNAHITDILRLLGNNGDSDVPWKFRWPFRWPAGWWDNNKSLVTDFLMDKLDTVDSRSQKAYPKFTRQLEDRAVQDSIRRDRFAPWRIWYTLVLQPLNSSQAIKFSLGQVRIDETRIACALERYRLAHGVYPMSLEPLVPECLEQLPHDIMNGASYHYRLNGDGTFLLYSVGWNQTDEGGKVIFKKDAPQQIDYEQGDWVWPAAEVSGSK